MSIVYRHLPFFRSLKHSDDSKIHLLDSEYTEDPLPPLYQRTLPSKLLWTFQVILFCASLFLFICSSNGLLTRSVPTGDFCTRKMEMPSPLHETIDDNLTPIRMEGRFWQENKYKGPPNPERDEAWDSLTNHGGQSPYSLCYYLRLTAITGGVMRISKDVLNSINASSHAAQFPVNMGGGYIASFEIVHQLHCIQFIREWTYRDYYQNKSVIFTDSEKTIRNHLGNLLMMAATRETGN